jgi:hypothetical protein
MSISIVNGYVCFNGCDVKRAETGRNPHDNPGQLDNDPRANSHKPVGATDQPAVTFGGALKDLMTASAVTASSASTAATANSSQPLLDVTV